MVEAVRLQEDWYPSRTGSKPAIRDRHDPVVYGGAEDGPLSAEQIQSYADKGFLNFRQLFSADELAPYIEELQRLRRSETARRMEQAITEPDSGELRSMFAIHENNKVLSRLCRHPRIVNIARQLLGSEVYIHQSRINYKPGFKGKEFYWHSDFETWHVEDGMPFMRAVSCTIALTPNTPHNGPLMLIPGSHKVYLSCPGTTPENHYQKSLKRQEIGVPAPEHLERLVAEHGIEAPTGPLGSVTFFECNTLHGSNSNITPLPRSNVFVVFNSVKNTLAEPFCGLRPRPHYLANRRDYSPLRPAEETV